jgi:hypothetical protein
MTPGGSCSPRVSVSPRSSRQAFPSPSFRAWRPPHRCSIASLICSDFRGRPQLSPATRSRNSARPSGKEETRARHPHTQLDTQLSEFFETFSRASDTLDAEALAGCFDEVFLAADATGAKAVPRPLFL